MLKSTTSPSQRKYFAFSLGKGVVDGFGGNCKPIVWCKSMSKGTDCIIEQNAKDFAEAAVLLVSTTHVIYIPQSKIDEEITVKNPFKCTILVNGIFTMHVIKIMRCWNWGETRNMSIINQIVSLIYWWYWFFSNAKIW